MQVIRYRENASSPWKEALMATAFTEGNGGGSGTWATAQLTRASEYTVDISNYVDGHDNFMLFFTYNGTSYRGFYAPFLSTDALCINTSNPVPSTGITKLFGNSSTDVFGQLPSSYGITFTYDKETGIIKMGGGSTATFGTNLVLVYEE